MTDGIDQQPWLRDALESLLDGEPPMSATTVWDDVRRGRTARAAVMRRRAVSLTAAAGLLLVAGPLTASLRPSPATVSGPSSPRNTSTSPTPIASSTPLTVTDVLESAGWTVTDVLTASPTPADGSAGPGTQSMYELRSPVGASGVVVTTYPPGATGAGLLARCTPSTCTDVGGTTPTSDAYQESRRLVVDAPGLGAGALVAERVWASGTTVDVGAGPVKPFPGATSQPALALTAAQVDAVLDLVGDPYDSPSAKASLAAAQAAAQAAVARAKADAAYAEAHPCATSDLLITQPWHDGATGTMLYGLVLHNRSGRACGLVGFPSVRLVGPSGVLPLAVRRDRGGAGFPMPAGPAALLLAPGGDAHSLVTKYRCDAGQLRPSRELQVTVNGSGPAAALPFTEWLCAGGAADPGNVLDVYGFYPGVSG